MSPKAGLSYSATTLLWLAIVILLAFANADYLFRLPIYEWWDGAANSLSIARAKHLSQLYGPFSRWGFHHPGPAFFYVQAFGEWLFYDVSRIVPAPSNGQATAHLGLMAFFFVAALRVFTQSLPQRTWWFFLVSALALAVLHFSATVGIPSFYDVYEGPEAFLSTWTAHALALPMLCLLSAAASIAAGRGGNLPLLVIAGSFQVHAHVAQPLFVLPIATVAYSGLILECARRESIWNIGERPLWQRLRQSVTAPWRVFRRAHLSSISFLAIFVLPLMLDSLRGSESNLFAIMRHMEAHGGEGKSLATSIVYFLQYAAYEPLEPGSVEFKGADLGETLLFLSSHAPIYLAWLAAAGIIVTIAVQALRENIGPRNTRKSRGAAGPRETSIHFLRWAVAFVVLAIALTLTWGCMQDGEMFYFNGWINFAIYYYAALVALAAIGWWLLSYESRRHSAVVRFLAHGVPAAVLVLFVGLRVDHLRGRDRTSADAGALVATTDRALKASDKGTIKILLFKLDVWSLATGIALQIKRAGHRFAVPDDWSVSFGKEYAWSSVFNSESPPRWELWDITTDQSMRTGYGRASALRNVSIQPASLPLLDLSNAAGTAEVIFGLDGNSEDYQISGWSGPEEWGTWTNANYAIVAFRPTAISGADVEVTVDGNPLLDFDKGVRGQRLRVFFNGERLGPELRLQKDEPVVLTIPAALWIKAASAPNAIGSLEFALPDAVSPASLGVANDRRRLGLGFRKIVFRALRADQP